MNRNIILLFGGESNERLVSVASAQFMAQALPHVTCWFWAKNSFIYEISKEDLLSHENAFSEEINIQKEPIFANLQEALSSPKMKDFIFLLALHGGTGEDGTAQKWLEDAQIPFTGSGSKASALAFDKVQAKALLANYHVRTAPHITLSWGPEAMALMGKFCEEHGQVILKPVTGGSTIGCVPILEDKDIEKALEELSKNPSQEYLLEKLIKGREITVGVIDTKDGPRALPCTEIVTESDRFFDYAGKYLGDGTKEVTPADIPPKMARLCQRVAIAAHAALGLEGYSRADLIVDENGPVFLETNTLPGLSKTSLLPQQLASAQITMREFLLQQLELGRNRMP